MDRKLRHRARRLTTWMTAVLPLAAHAAPPDGHDLTAYSLEQLMNIEVVSASRYPQQLSEVPAAVTIITAGDIRRFGYRTLADILRGVRGFYTSYDRQYDYIGVRGFSPPGDYNSRLLVLVDGYRINDNVYDTGPIGGEFPLDVDLIERVEIVRGPASSLYGSNALFGVVNVITRRGAAVGGGEAAATLSSHGGREGRLSYGRRTEGGVDVLLSASGLHRDGPNLYFPEFDTPETGLGRTTGTDDESHRKFFAKLAYGGWGLSLMHSSRDKGLTGGAWGSLFDDPRSHMLDEMTRVSLGHQGTLGSRTEVSTRLYYDDYRFTGDYLYGLEAPTELLNRDIGEGRWWGVELKLLSALGRHKLAYGVEYQDNLRQDQRNFDLDPVVTYIDERHESQRWGAYLQDEFPLAERWALSAGLRYDRFDAAHGSLTPRVGLVHQLDEEHTLKLLYGSAYRTPNVYERFYAFPGQQEPNPDLAPERLRSIEAVWEYRPGPGLRLTGSAYHYRIDDWIVQQLAPGTGLYQFENQGRISAHGLELELEKRWRNDIHLRASYTAQVAPERTDQAINGAPRHMLKGKLSAPLGSDWRAGAEYLYTSRRATTSSHTGGYAVTNLTLLYQPRPGGPEISLSLYNLFDQEYADPAIDPGVPEREVITQDGRTWRLKAALPF